MSIQLYDSIQLAAVIAELPINTGAQIWNAVFNRGPAVQSTATSIAVDRITLSNLLMPFGLPDAPAPVVREGGYTTDTFTPPYATVSMPINAGGNFLRLPGQQINAAPNPQAVRQQRLAAAFKTFVDMKTLLLEWMATQALLTGGYTITSTHYPTTPVTFGRHASLTITLSGGDRWGQSGVNPLANLETWAQTANDLSHGEIRNVIMGTTAWNHFRASSAVASQLSLERGGQTIAPTLESTMNQGSTLNYKGQIGGFNIWVTSAAYKNTSGTEVRFIPAEKLIMFGDVAGITGYGAIQALQSLVPTDIYLSNWIEHNPEREWTAAATAPMVIPLRPNASIGATVA